MLANSDSEADQNVKKQVRDAVGAYIEPYLLECENIEETRATVNDHMDEIIAVSKETLAANGFYIWRIGRAYTHRFPGKDVWGLYIS